MYYVCYRKLYVETNIQFFILYHTQKSFTVNFKTFFSSKLFLQVNCYNNFTLFNISCLKAIEDPTHSSFVGQ